MERVAVSSVGSVVSLSPGAGVFVGFQELGQLCFCREMVVESSSW